MKSEIHKLIYRLAEIMLQQEQHVLPVDLLFDDAQIGEFVKSIQIDSPYQQLLLEGVLTESVREEKLYVNFTVEGYFHYVLGDVIYDSNEALGAQGLKNIVDANKLKGAKEGVEQCLKQDVQLGNLDRVMQFIDEGPSYKNICVNPLLECLKTQGSKTTLDTILSNPTDHDWEALFSLDKLLEELQLNSLRKTFLQDVMPRNPFKTKASLWLGLKAIEIFDKAESEKYLNGINAKNPLVLEDDDLLRQLGLVYKRLGSLDMAINYFEKVLEIRVKNHGHKHINTANIHNNLGNLWLMKRNYIKALFYHEKSLEIKLKILGNQHEETGASYNNLGNVWKRKGNHDKAVECYDKSFDIFSKVYGHQHPLMGVNCLNLGAVWNRKGEFVKALFFLEKSLNIFLNTHGNQHPWTGDCFQIMGLVWGNIGDYDKEFEYYDKSLKIKLKVDGNEHPSIGNIYKALGIDTWKKKGDYVKAIDYLEKALTINLKVHGDLHSSIGDMFFCIGLVYQDWKKFEKAIQNFLKGYKIHTSRNEFPFRLAQCYESLSEFNLALKYYVEAAEMRKEGLGQTDSATIDAARNALLLSKSLKAEATLPSWIRESEN